MLNTGQSKKIEVNSKIKIIIDNNNHNDSQKKEPLETKEEKLYPYKISNKLDFKKIAPQISNKIKDSYSLNQAKSLINRMNLKKQTTLKKLEDLSVNDLKPFQETPFFPEDMFDKNTGDDDIYLAEYALKPNDVSKKSPKIELKSKIQVIQAPLFRKSKSKSPPRQNVFESKNIKYREDFMGSPRSDDVKKPDYKAKMLERAKLIDIANKEKENQVIFSYKIIDKNFIDY